MTSIEGFGPPREIAFTQKALTDKAKDYMTHLYGKPSDSNDVDRWMERFGLICGFIDEQFNPTEPDTK